MCPTRYASCILLSLAACVAEPDVADGGSDGRNDSFLGAGKADAAGIPEGSPDALAVLHVANTATLEELDANVNLDHRAAEAIVAVRIGDDETPGTADDTEFTTLAQLDAVPWVGPVAFARLLAYARSVTDDYANTRDAATDVGVIDGDNSNYVQTYQGTLAFAGDQDWLVAHLSPHSDPGDPRPGFSELEVALIGPAHMHAQLEAFEVAYDRLGHRFENRVQVDQDSAGQTFGLLTLVYGVASVDLYVHVTSKTVESSNAPYTVWLWFHQ